MHLLYGDLIYEIRILRKIRRQHALMLSQLKAIKPDKEPVTDMKINIMKFKTISLGKKYIR